MKNKYPSLLVLFACAAMVASIVSGGCQQSKQAQRIETADSLKTELESLHAVFTDIDYDKHFQNRADIMKNIERIEQFYASRNDTMPRDIAMTLSDYRLVWKGYKRMEGEYGQVEKELEYTNNQLINLKKDLEHNALPDNMADRFIEEESKAVAALAVTTNSLKTKMESTEQKYLDKKPVITQLIDSLTKQN